MSLDILMLSAAHPPEDVRIVQKQGAALAAAGFRVAHLAPGSGEAAEFHGVRILPVAGASGWRARIMGIGALARRAAALAPRAIHAHEPDSWLAARMAARRCGARVVLDVHEHYPSRLDAQLPRVMRPLGRVAIGGACRALAAGADAVIVAKDGLDDAFGGAARCTPVRNYATALPIAPRRHADGPLTLLHLGALGRSRGAFLMLDALALLPPATRLTLIGRFTDGTEDAFWAAATASGLRARITSLPWMERPAALAEAARCDIALVLFQPGIENHRLALPHKLFDAMLAGLPVIVPDFATEVAGVVASTGCGLAIDVANPASIADAVRALASPDRRNAMGARGRAAALGRYGWDAEAARLVELYRRLLG